MKRTALFTIALIALALCTHAQEIARYKGNARAAVSYTFDDGLKEHYTMVLPHLDSLGIKGTFWIIANNIDIDKPMVGHIPATWDEVNTIAEHGHELGNHGYTHTALNEITPEQITQEIAKNDSAIYAHTGVHTVSFCFPGNGRPQWVIDQVLAHPGITGARTYEKGVGGGITVQELDSWLQHAMEHGDWAVAMIHGITHGWDRFDNPSVLWTHLHHASDMAADGQLWIARFDEVTAYTRGLSDVVTYVLPRKPKSVKQQGKKITTYQSWDGRWCVDAKRNVKLSVKY